jgi:hypothetical protein
MPTPSPIKMPSVGPAEGMSTTWDSSPAVIRPGTSAAIATARGSNMASSEPNAMNSTTAAASTPTAALMPAEGRSTFSTAGPPSSTCRPGARAASARWTTRVTSAAGRLACGASKTTVA